MDRGQDHVPFRVSKMTMAIRDSFISKDLKGRVVMFACICPGSSSSDHTLNTLRYADRLKGKRIQQTYNNAEQGGVPDIPLPQKLEPKKEVLP